MREFMPFARVVIALAAPLLVTWGCYLVSCVFEGKDVTLFWNIKTHELATSEIGLFAAILATAGWLTTALISRSNSIKQHTMNVLTQVRLSNEMNKHIDTLFSKFPLDTVISAQDLSDSKIQDDWRRSARYIANYYEFLAVALRYGDLDEKLLKDCIRSQFVGFCTKIDVLIDQAVKADPKATVNRFTNESDSKALIDLRRLRKKWNY